MRSPGRLSIVAAAPLVILLAAVSVAAAQAAKSSPNRSGDVAARGKQLFSSSCAQCHGLDGKGSERAPNIADRENIQRLTDSQISHIIENGVPGTGMPAFHTFNSTQVRAVVGYLRVLQGKNQAVALPGNPQRGKDIFFGKAGCSECHMAGGEGGFIASDLSHYARSHTVEQMREAIVHPSAGKQVRSVTVTLRSGEKYAGRVRNEDNFSLQLQTLDGAFHFLNRSNIEKIEADSQPLMPSDYTTRLEKRELDDVVSFLMTLGSGGPDSPKESEEWEQ
jgi:putative heme-binding domain-containing protein